MLPTVRNDFVERSLMEHGTSLQAGWSYRRPSPRSRCYCQSRSWMATQRRCWPTLQRQQGNCVSSLLRRLALLTDLAFHSTQLSLTRFFELFLILKNSFCTLPQQHYVFVAVVKLTFVIQKKIPFYLCISLIVIFYRILFYLIFILSWLNKSFYPLASMDSVYIDTLPSVI